MSYVRMKLAEVITLQDKHDEKLLFGQFLDDYYSVVTDEKYELIKDEPPYMGDQEMIGSLAVDHEAERLYCKLAATAHHLAVKYNHKIPEWVFKPCYTAAKECYAFDTKTDGYRKLLKDQALPEFVQRNLYYGDNVLDRC